MTKQAFDKIAEGLNEALAIAKGESDAGRLHVPDEFDVKAIRKRLQLSQDRFAAAFGFTIYHIREWEQGRARPLGGVRAYLMMIDSDPDAVRRMLIEASRKFAA